jgi:hypothetical protein
MGKLVLVQTENVNVIGLKTMSIPHFPSNNLKSMSMFRVMFVMKLVEAQ